MTFRFLDKKEFIQRCHACMHACVDWKPGQAMHLSTVSGAWYGFSGAARKHTCLTLDSAFFVNKIEGFSWPGQLCAMSLVSSHSLHCHVFTFYFNLKNTIKIYGLKVIFTETKKTDPGLNACGATGDFKC